MMDIAKILLGIAHGNWLTDTEHDDKLRLRAMFSKTNSDSPLAPSTDARNG